MLVLQANLGLRRAVQCEKCLALGSMLAMKEPNMTTNVMRSQLSRLYGQLYAFQVGGEHRDMHQQCGANAAAASTIMSTSSRPRSSFTTLPRCSLLHISSCVCCCFLLFLLHCGTAEQGR